MNLVFDQIPLSPLPENIIYLIVYYLSFTLEYHLYEGRDSCLSWSCCIPNSENNAWHVEGAE